MEEVLDQIAQRIDGAKHIVHQKPSHVFPDDVRSMSFQYDNYPSYITCHLIGAYIRDTSGVLKIKLSLSICSIDQDQLLYMEVVAVRPETIHERIDTIATQIESHLHSGERDIPYTLRQRIAGHADEEQLEDEDIEEDYGNVNSIDDVLTSIQGVGSVPRIDEVHWFNNLDVVDTNWLIQQEMGMSQKENTLRHMYEGTAFHPTGTDVRYQLIYAYEQGPFGTDITYLDEPMVMLNINYRVAFSDQYYLRRMATTTGLNALYNISHANVLRVGKSFAFTSRQPMDNDELEFYGSIPVNVKDAHWPVYVERNQFHHSLDSLPTYVDGEMGILHTGRFSLPIIYIPSVDGYVFLNNTSSIQLANIPYEMMDELLHHRYQSDILA